MPGDFGPFEAKLKEAKLNDAFIHSFKSCYDKLVAGDGGTISEASIQAVRAQLYPLTFALML